MSEFPPPVPPQAPVPAGVRSPGGDQWDWDRTKDLAERWFRPLAERAGWMALVYLFASSLIAPFLFVAMVVVFGLTFGLAFVLVGVLLVVPWFLLVERLAGIDRRLAAIAGHAVGARPAEPLPHGAGPRSLRVAITDPVRWRHVGYVAANIVLAPVFLAVGVFPLTVVVETVTAGGFSAGPFFGAGLDGGPLGILALPVAAVLAGAIPRVAIWTAELKARVTAWFFGTDRLAVAERRVSDLATQRQDILDAVASERRRIERNLHDGVQQQLVAIGLDLGMAEQQIDGDPVRARELVVSARQKVQGSIGELRQLGRGLHPAILADRGIDAALSAVVSGSPIPISVHVDGDLDLTTDVAETVYFVANEAIANILKHARASVASVHVTELADQVRITVHDDGVGGIDPTAGTGIAGIRARVHAVDGRFNLSSPSGGPTTLIAEIPRRRAGTST